MTGGGAGSVALGGTILFFLVFMAFYAIFMTTSSVTTTTSGASVGPAQVKPGGGAGVTIDPPPEQRLSLAPIPLVVPSIVVPPPVEPPVVPVPVGAGTVVPLRRQQPTDQPYHVPPRPSR
jgi:hypothetical protein